MPLETALILAVVITSLITLILAAIGAFRPQRADGDRLEAALREELRATRDETAQHARQLREEVGSAQQKANDMLVGTVNALGESQKALLGQLTRATHDALGAVKDEIGKLALQINDSLRRIQQASDEKLEAVRVTTDARLTTNEQTQRQLGEELKLRVQGLSDVLRQDMGSQRESIQFRLNDIQAANEARFEQVREAVTERLNATLDELRKLLGSTTTSMLSLAETSQKDQQAARDLLEQKFHLLQASNEAKLEAVRQTVTEQLRQLTEDQRKLNGELVTALTGITEANRLDQASTREALEQKFQQIQASNERKLDEMRQTVDEKLQGTLEKRLGESFKLVSDRLEAVQRGLGEMKSLADGVGDLKRVLTNVKERGTWGEYQLGAILEQILTPEQYAQNVRPKEGGEVVEFAVKLPGKNREAGAPPVWLPIDAKFPKEDYERLLQASEIADADGVKSATAALASSVRKAAKDIYDKYVAPPHTTDFAILFLPTEGLYAEVLRQPGLQDDLQSKYRVLVTGPTTLSAMLNSLRVGFQTLAIEQRSHEVWHVLGAVKTEFGKFGQVLDKVKRQLHSATDTIDRTHVRTRAMERKLRSVEQLPEDQARELLELPDGVAMEQDESDETDVLDA